MPAGADTARNVSDQVHQRLQQLSNQVKATLRVPHADAIHDLRVAIRRLLQTLGTLRAWLVTTQYAAIRRQLENLLATAGAVRDCDIGMEVLGKIRVPDAAEIGEALHFRREAAGQRLSAALRRWINLKRASLWREQLAQIETPAACKAQSWEDLARVELPRAAKAFFRSGRRAVKSEASASDLHGLRIQAKQLRYTLEMFASTYPPSAEACITSLHEVQNVLGRISDMRTVRKLVDDLEGGRKLSIRLRKKQRKRIAAFSKDWETRFPRSQAREWVDFLRQPPRKPPMRSTAAAGKRDAPGAITVETKTGSRS